jgi:integrase
MATLRRTPKSNAWQVRFKLNGKDKSIGLGERSESQLQEWRINIESLLRSRKNGTPRDDATDRWLAGLSAKDRRKLESHGLIASAEEKETVTLAEYMDSLFAADKADRKPNTNTFRSQIRRNLIDHFGLDRSIDSITPADAREFKTFLESSNRRDKGRKDLAAATVRRRLGTARQIFAAAVEEGLLPSNPFQQKAIRTTVRSNKDRMVYVPVETVELVKSKAPAKWRLILSLARTAGLRIPSEIAGLKWSHIAWDDEDPSRHRMMVLSPKTEHHEGHESRVIPLFPEVAKELRAWMLECPETHDDSVFPDITAESNLRTQTEKLIRRAGVEQWPKLYNNLRSSAATDLVRKHPIHIATKICGHCAEVATEHYWQVDPDVDFKAVLDNHPSTTVSTAIDHHSRQSQITNKNTANPIKGRLSKENTGLDDSWNSKTTPDD